MYILQPITITGAMIGPAATLPEDPTPVWVSGTSYAAGAEVHRVQTHRVYRAISSISASTIAPELDKARWEDMRVTNKMAPFDTYISTAATTTSTDIVYPITARFVNAIALYGLIGSAYDITIKDTAGGSIIWQRSGTLKRHGRGWWNYFFGERNQISKLAFFGLPIRPAAEITITISGADGSTRALGLVVMGKTRSLVGGLPGGTESGASAEPVSFSYIKTDADGVTTIVRRNSGTNLRARVFIQREQADVALRILQDVLDIPVAVIATDADGFAGLQAFGLISSSPVQYKEPHAYIDVNVKGMI